MKGTKALKFQHATNKLRTEKHPQLKPQSKSEGQVESTEIFPV